VSRFPDPSYLARDFYGDERRAASSFVDFGDPWYDGSNGAWRVQWLTNTGELVAMSLARGGTPGNSFLEEVIYNILFPRPAPNLAVLAVETDAAAMTRKLAGWEEHVGERDGMDWLRRRVEPAPEAPGTASPDRP
jgi:hypothetical protein